MPSSPAPFRSVVVTRLGGLDVLEVRSGPIPKAGPGEVVVAIDAAGVAVADLLMRRGTYPSRPKPPFVPGYDLVGTITALGPGVTGPVVGQRVAALTVTGSYATHSVVPASKIVPMPAGPSAPSLVALVLNYVTAWQMLHRIADVQAGQSVLVVGGAGGVGTALLELCRLGGIAAIATASGDRTQMIVERGGIAIDRRTADVAIEVGKHFPDGVDATFDPVGGPSLQQYRAVTKRSGSVVSYGAAFAADDQKHAAIMARAGLALARAKVTPGASTSLYQIAGKRSFGSEPPEALADDLTHLAGLVADGTLDPRVETMPLDQAADAQRRLESGNVLGKLVLLP